MADKPNEQDLFPLLRKVGLVDDEPYIAIESIKEMAGSNIIARFESKLGARMDSLDARMDAQTTSLDARMDAQTASLDARMVAMDARMDARMVAMDARMDARISALTSSLNATNTQLKFLMWIVGIGIAVIGLGPILLRIFAIPA